MSPLTGGGLRPPRRLRRLGYVLFAVLALGATCVVAVAGLAVGRDLAAGDSATVATVGVGAQPPKPERRELAPAIDLAGEEEVRVRLDRPPRAALLFDVESGDALWSRHPRDILPIASLTKVMTALIVAERTSSRERAKVTRAALNYAGSGVGVLPRGKRVPVDALLHGLLLVSGNDAAIALADHVAGSEREFVELMNRRARELGLGCTHFRSAYGLEQADRSCAADLAALSRLALRERRIARVVRRLQAAVRFPIAGGRLYLNSTNPLLRLRYPGTIGLKTGYTARAGRTYIGVVRRGGRTLGVVLLDSPDPGLQAKQIFDRAFGKRAARGRRAGRGSERATARENDAGQRPGSREEGEPPGREKRAGVGDRLE